MTVRNDIKIVWNVSPRLIIVNAPSIELTVQDLVDTCREHEDNVENLQYSHLVDASGKQPLPGSAFVGVTAILQNARVQFESRSNPPTILCAVTGGNLVAVDENGYDMEAVEPSSYVTVMIAQSTSPALVQPLTLDTDIDDLDTENSIGLKLVENLKLRRTIP